MNICSLVCLTLLSFQYSHAEIIGTGFLPGDNGAANGGVSGDGSTVLGSSTTGGSTPNAYIWNADTGLIAPVGTSSSSSSAARSASYNGQFVAVGSFTDAYRWSEDLGLQDLGSIIGGSGASVQDISSDGSVVVGRASIGVMFEAFYWTQTQGMLSLDLLPGVSSGRSIANAVSGNGAIVVGSSTNAFGSTEAIRWTVATGMIPLGTLEGASFSSSSALGVSDDGSTIVGESESKNGDEAFLWRQSIGFVGLGDLPGGDFESRAIDVSGDGLIVIGVGTTGIGDEAFVWTADDGIQRLEDSLDGLEVDFSNWQTLTAATGISDDGRVIVGTGINSSGQQEGYRLFRYLLGDVNLDGAVNLLDVDPFISVLTSGEFQAEADINLDGSVDLIDVAPFLDLLGN